jgi:hypothetical protein
MSLRLLQRHFGKQKFHYVVPVASATVVIGALGVFEIEFGQNTNIRRFGDALW